MIIIGIDAINIRQGGGVTHLAQMLKAFEESDFPELKIIIWANKNFELLIPKSQNIEVRTNWWIDSILPIRLLWQLLIIQRDIRLCKVDVFFCPGGIAPFFINIPIVVMSQNLLPFEINEAKRFGKYSYMYIKLMLLRFIQSRSFLKANGLIFLTEYAKTTVNNLIGDLNNKSIVIPHGLEKRFFKKTPALLNSNKFDIKSPFKILYVSILMPYKHQINVAIAIDRLRSMGVPVTIEFVGKSVDRYGRQFEEKIFNLDSEREYLIFNGEHTFDTLEKVYHSSDAFIFASTCENMPNILLEAMASGLPIACSHFGPMPEILENAGVFFNPESIESISNAIAKIFYDHKFRNEIATLAMLRAQGYSWERCSRDTFSYIIKVYLENKRVKNVRQ